MGNSRVSVSAIILIMATILGVANSGLAEVGTPRITSAVFDSNGKLVVTSTHPGAYAGCYLVVNGGLRASNVSTQIVGKQLSSAAASAVRTTIKTARRYYCQQRNLYVNVEVVCVGDEVAQKNSAVVKVAVPSRNVRRSN